MKITFITFFLLNSIFLICTDILGQNNIDIFINYLSECKINFFSVNSDELSANCIIQTDTIISKNYAKITIESFDLTEKTKDIHKIDSILRTRYKNTEILSSEISDNKFGSLFVYTIDNPEGNPFIEKYSVQSYQEHNYLFSFRTMLGNNIENSYKFDCFLNHFLEVK